MRVEEVAKYVREVGVANRSDLDSRNQIHFDGVGGSGRLGPAGRGVVVGEGDDIKSRPTAARTSSLGVSVPSEAVEWVCRSDAGHLSSPTSAAAFGVVSNAAATSWRV